MPDRLPLRILGWAKTLLDESVPPERLRAFMAEALAQAEASLSSGRASLPADSRRELIQARSLAARLGLIPALPGTPPTGQDADPDVLQRAEAWLARLGDGKAISRSGLTPGAGPALIVLLERTPNERLPLLENALVSLLRHVETRRRAGLRLSSTAPGVDPWMEWLSVAVLFARAARRRGDLRFLNAAFKLNDWAYPVHRRIRPGPRLARYLLSLAEQETAVSEELG